MAQLQKNEILGRMIRSEGIDELCVGTPRKIEELIDAGKPEEAKAMVDYFRTEMLVVHDIYAQYVQDLLAFIAELRQIQQFILLYPPQGDKGPNRIATVLSKTTLAQQALVKTLGLEQLHITQRG